MDCRGCTRLKFCKGSELYVGFSCRASVRLMSDLASSHCNWHWTCFTMRKVGRTEVEQWCAEVDIVNIMHCGEAYVNVARTVKWGLPQVGTRHFACHLHCWRGVHDVIFLECVTSASIFRKTALTTFFFWNQRIYWHIDCVPWSDAALSAGT